MKSLIVNADDAGLSAGINEAVRACYRAGVITGTSLMACGRQFAEAAGMLGEMGRTEVGVHLTLTGGLSPCTQDRMRVDSLLRKGGVFCRDYKTFAALYFRRRIAPKHVRTELAEQIRRVQSEGLRVTHLDGHEHVHMFPDVLKVALSLALEFGVPYVRLPRESARVLRWGFSMRDMARYVGLRSFAAWAVDELSRAKIAHNDAFLGHFHAGRMSDGILTSMVDGLGEGVTELAVHPAVMSWELLDESPWHRNGQRELDVLLSGKWRERALARGVRLISHRQVPGVDLPDQRED